MVCKNCSSSLEKSDKFCAGCGAKIMRERITFKNVIADSFFKAIGWDNKYLVTIKTLIIRPELVLRGYLEGMRKRYVNPIAFFVIGMTATLIIFNVFQDDFIRISAGEEVDIAVIEEQANHPFLLADLKRSPEQAESQRQQIIFIAKIQKTLLKYFNIYSFVLLPIYTFIAFLVFRKRYNYTEHLVINSYLQGMGFIFTILFFFLSMFIGPKLYQFTAVLAILYYSYAYARLFEQSFWKAALHLLKFIGIGTVFIFILVLIGVLIGLIAAMFFGQTP